MLDFADFGGFWRVCADLCSAVLAEAEANPEEFFSVAAHNRAIRRLQAEEAAGRLVVHEDGTFEDRGVALPALPQELVAAVEACVDEYLQRGGKSE